MARLSQKTKEEEESLIHGFYELPLPREREKMSVVQLAEILSDCKENTLPHIVISHELNMKISKEQSRATLNASLIGATAVVVSALVTAYLGYLLSTRQPMEFHYAPEHKASTKREAKCTNTEKTNQELLAPNVTIVNPPSIEPNHSNGANNGQKKKK